MAIWFALSRDYNPEYVVDRNNIFLDIDEIERWEQVLRPKKEAQRLYFETRDWRQMILILICHRPLTLIR